MFDRMVRRSIFAVLGAATAAPFGALNRFRVQGRSHLDGLPRTNVLFLANHLTYFFDVIALHHAIASGRASHLTGLRSPAGLSFIAARETMQSGALPRMFAMGGAVLVKRTWKEGAERVHRPADPDDVRRIGEALRGGWLISFPQGTTRAGAPVRRSAALLALEHRPIIVPTRLTGFDRAFERAGVTLRSTGHDLGVRFGAPFQVTGDESPDALTAHIAAALGLPHTSVASDPGRPHASVTSDLGLPRAHRAEAHAPVLHLRHARRRRAPHAARL